MATNCIIQNSIDLPGRTNFLGVDGEGYEHHHEYVEGRVFVYDGDDLVREQDLEGRSVFEWIAFTRAEHGEWRDLRYSRKGLDGLVEDIVDGFTEDEDDDE